MINRLDESSFSAYKVYERGPEVLEVKEECRLFYVTLIVLEFIF